MNCRPTSLALLLLAACAQPKSAASDGIDRYAKPFDRVAIEDVVTLTGTEPFWTLTIARGEGRWVTPDNQTGTRLALKRFAGNNGLGFSGTLDGRRFTAALTPGQCSDGMSDRRYPYVATIALGGETLAGCGYTTSQPFTGEEGKDKP